MIIDVLANDIEVDRNVLTVIGVTAADSGTVVNNGAVDGQLQAVLVGTQNGGQVHTRIITEQDPPGGGSSQFAFPPVDVAALGAVPGQITWTVQLFDADPDNDEATATTTVVR